MLDGVVSAALPPCARGEKLVEADLAGLAVLAAPVNDSESPDNLA